MSHAATDASPRPPLFVSPLEAARLLEVSRGQVYAMLNDGTLPSTRIGRLHRIPVDALHELADRPEREG